ncbi:MAG TPA: subtype B tannase [Syntrophorhabdales bacterium]|nr:subtype B tannase [Syntrophorhabdales bacterium]
MKTARLTARLLCIAMMLALLPAVGWATDPLALPAPTGTLHVTVDGTSFTVTYYQNVVYVTNPVQVKSGSTYTYNYQSMNIYVPQNATENSPIILQDNNSGWIGAPPGASVVDGTAYSTDSTNTTNQKVAAELRAGYVIANVGCRSRNTTDVNGNYIGHAPAQVVDVKAAIRYLRYNDAAMPGTTKRIIITGTSGGGALGVAIAAGGNNPDYYPYLYALGAAGVTCNSSTCSSTLEDDVFGTVLYCPIADLNHMDAAYEWMYGQTRKELPTFVMPDGTVLTYSTAQYDASDFYAADYVTYFNGLGLTDENGKGLTASNFRDAIKAAAEYGVEKAYRELGTAQMAADSSSSTYPDSSWYSVNKKGKATVNLDKYLYFVAKNTQLKGIPASDNLASPLPKPEPSHNESTEAGTTSQAYSNFDDWAWNNNAIKGDGVGYDDTGLQWKDFIQTNAGKAVVKQMDMISPMPYLVKGTGDAAPYWYFRAGMKDRDTSFDVPVALYYAVLNSRYVDDVNFNLAWLKPHAGDYDVPEAYEWVAEAVDNAKYFDLVDAAIPNTVTQGFSLPTGDQYNVITYRSSNKKVFNVVNGQAVVTPPAKKDATVTLTVRVVSDRIFAFGFYNYGKVDVTREFAFIVPAGK